jgi:hypothetical protein
MASNNPATSDDPSRQQPQQQLDGRRCHYCHTTTTTTMSNMSSQMSRSGVVELLLGGTAAAAAAVVTFAAPPALALAGTEAKIELPNPYQQMAERATRQCLVESLGNRECLVYADDADQFLYQGADALVLLQRIEKSRMALETIPMYVDNRQWSKISSVLTGPMGDLLPTLNLLADNSSSDAKGTRQRIKTIKVDLYALADAVGRKDSAMIRKYHTAATNDLIALVKAL